MFKKTILLLVPSLFALATFISLFSFWLGDLFSHFRIFWTVLSFIFLIGYIILFIKKIVFQKHIVLISIVFIVNLIGSFSFWKNPQTYDYLFFGNPVVVEYSQNVKQEIESDTTVKKLLLMNILSSNTNYEEVRKLIKNVDADFVVIIELSKKWELELKEISHNYSYQFTEARTDNFGMGFYAKQGSYFKTRIEVNSENPSTFPPCIYFIDKEESKNFKLIVLHPIPPINKKSYQERNIYLDKMAYFTKNRIHHKKLLVGDLNCSPFSADYKKILLKTGLKDSQQNFGFQPTWNSAFPFLMQTQLDHVWHSEDIEILHRQTLPISGSDHKAVLVVFR